MPRAEAESALMDTIFDKSATELAKTEAYKALSQQLRNNDGGDAFVAFKSKCSNFLDVVLEDSGVEKTDLAQAALQVLGVCLHENQFTSKLSPVAIDRIITSLCDTIKKSKDKTSCTRALWCLSTQNLSSSSYEGHIPKLVAVVEHAMCSGIVRSPIVEHESINVVIRLLDQCPNGMEKETIKWAKLMYPMLVHAAGKVRERALIALERGMPLILKNPEIQDTISGDLAQDLKLLLLSEMEELSKNEEPKVQIAMLKAWIIFVKLLGKRLHNGGFLNKVLPVVEHGFKGNKQSEVRIAAYQGWTALVDCFALNKAILEDHRRIKLIMQVYRVTTAKVEAVALEKFHSWWHYVVAVNPSNPTLFEQIVVPLINFCLGIGKSGPNTPAKGVSPATPSRTPVLKRNASGGFSSPPTPNVSLNSSISSQFVFRPIQLKGLEVLAQLLGPNVTGSNLPKAEFTIDQVDSTLVDQQIFTKQGLLVVGAVRELLYAVGNVVQDGVLYHLWYALVTQLQVLLEHGSRKDNVDIFTAVLTCLQDLVFSQAIDGHKILRMIEILSHIPGKVLASPAYNVGTLTSATVMQGCPASTLIDLLFQKQLLVHTSQERFFTIIEKLIAHGITNSVGALGFLQTCLTCLEVNADNLSTEIMWRLWSVIVNPLLEHIMKTNEVNQGDALEHNFTCLYKSLEFPLNRLLSADLHQGSLKSMMKTWTELYTTFARLAAMVPNAEANVCCEELGDKILASSSQEKIKTGIVIEYMSAVCKVMVDTLDFSSLTQPNILSPVKFGKKKQKPLGNIHSLVKLTSQTSEALHSLLTNEGASFFNKKSTDSVQNLISPANDLTHVMSQLFNHLPTAPMILAALGKLVSPVAQFLNGAANRTSKLYTQQFQQKLEKLWLDISTCIQGRFTGGYDSDFLAVVAPLLAATFLHPRRPIKNQAIILWNSTFAQSPPLEYPEILVPVLTKVKEKTPIILPGWTSKDLTVIEDTPVSQMSQAGESNVPVPNVIGLPSPHKSHGSFMNRVASPNIKKSPMLSPRPFRKSPVPATSPGPAKRKIPMAAFEDLSSSDYVVIKSSPKKKLVLTEHQKEKMRERRGTVPALYSNLDNSIDVSLMGQFVSTESQSSNPTPTPPVSFAPFKFPTSTSEEIKQKGDKKAAEKEEASDDLNSSVDETEQESRPTRRSKRKSKVQFSVESKDENTKQDTEDPKKPAESIDLLDVVQEEPMDTEPTKQGQKYDAFGFMTPSGDSVISSQECSGSQPEQINATGDHHKEPNGPVKDDDSSDVDMLDPNLTVAEELTQAQNESPKRAYANKLKDFILSGQDSDASQDVPSERNKDDDVEMDIEKPQEGLEKKNAENKEKTILDAVTSDDKSELESNVGSDDSQITMKFRRSRRSLVTASPVRSSPRSKGTQRKALDSTPSTRVLRRSVSDLTARDLSEESEGSMPPASAPSHILVEDSQQFSPSKFKGTVDPSETFVEESQQFSPPAKHKTSKSVDETPQKLDFAGAFDSTVISGSNKNLFSETVISDSEQDRVDLPQQAEPPQITTPTKRPPIHDVSSPSSPVVKLYKLSQEDILKMSPSKQAANDSFTAPAIGSPPKSVSRGVRKRASLLRASKAASQDKKSEETVSSNGNKVNIDDIIPSSQDAFAFAVQNSLGVPETQFTPQMLGLLKKSNQVTSLSVCPKSDNSVLKDVNDMDVTVIEKDKAPEETVGKVEVDPKQKSESDSPDSKLESQLLMMSESGTDSKVSSASGCGAVRNPDIIPADIDMSRESDDSQATIVSSRIKRRKSKRILDELKSNSELPDSESSESQPSQPKRRGRPKKKAPLPDKGDDSSVLESTDGQKPELSDAESSFSEASETSKAKDGDLKSQLEIATMEDHSPLSQESKEFKVPEIPDSKVAPEIVEVDGSESEDSVICMGDDHRETTTRGRRRSKRSAKNMQKDLLKEAEDSIEQNDESDSSQCSQSSQSSQSGRTLRSRRGKSKEFEELQESKESQNSEKDEGGEEKDSTVQKVEVQSDDDDDDDVPLNKLKSKNLAEVEKSPAGSKSDPDDDTPLSLFLSRSEASDTPKSSQEAPPVETAEEMPEPMVVEDTAPQSCADMFADSETSKDVKAEDGADAVNKENAEEPAADKNTTDTKEVVFTRPNRGRRSRLSLDSRRRKSPITSPKDSSLMKAALKLRKKASSPVVAISPLSKVNKAIVEKQLSQIANGAENNSDIAKVEVVDMQAVISIKNNGKSDEATDTDGSKAKGTLHNLNKGVSKSPPKKGKPFDTPETPTSASKYVSRSQYILERSRKICLAKSSSPLMSARKLLVPKKSPRGILKNSPTVRSPDKSNGPIAALHNSPQASKLPISSESPPTFRPIQIPKIYSPSASPSAGILKRRRLSGDAPADSPSPPNKQRRVCFNDSLDVCELQSSNGQSSPNKPINRCLEMGNRGHGPSPLVASVPSKVQPSSSNPKFITTPSKPSSSETRNRDQDGFAIPDSVSMKKTDESQSDDSCVSTQGASQMNCKDPVCPDLVECDAPVEDILPQLTTTMWVRGLGQLVRAKSIRTVGQLSAMSEYDINALPIRSPKIATTRSALSAFAEQLKKKTDKQSSTATAEEGSKRNVLMNGVESPDKDSLPSADDVLDHSPVKSLDFDTSMNSDQEEDTLAALKENSINTEALSAVREEASRVLAAVNTTSNVITETLKSPTRKKLLKDLKDMKTRMSPAVLSQLPSHQLVELHQQLNEMMTSVVFALKSKCAASPQVSQSSQSDSE